MAKFTVRMPASLFLPLVGYLFLAVRGEGKFINRNLVDPFPLLERWGVCDDNTVRTYAITDYADVGITYFFLRNVKNNNSILLASVVIFFW